MEYISIFPRRGEAKGFPEEDSTLPLTHIPCILSHVEKYLLQLKCTYHHCVTFLGIFTRHFFYHTNDLFSLKYTVLQPITFGLIIPNSTANIMRVSTNPKPITQAKLFSGFDMIWVHYQNTFGGFGVKPTTHAGLFYKNNLQVIVILCSFLIRQ